MTKTRTESVPTLNGIPLHSSRDPFKEASRFLNQFKTDSSQKSILIAGLGWGYLADAAAADTWFKNRNLYFYEPSENVSRHLIQTGRYRELLLKTSSFPNIMIFFRIQELIRRIQADQEPLSVIINPAYQRAFPGLPEMLSAFLTENSHDMKSSQIFLRQWIRNSVMLHTHYSPLDFLDAPEQGASHNDPEVPLVYCGGGPDLIENLFKAADPGRLKEKIWLISSDTAAAPLLLSGLSPDLILSADSGRGTLYHFYAMMHSLPRDSRKNAALASQPPGTPKKNLKLSSVPFSIPALTWTPGPLFLHSFFHHTVYYRTGFPLDTALAANDETFASLSLVTNPVRNAAGIALHIAEITGRKEIFMAGSLFRSKNGVSHERGTGYQYYSLLDCSRTSPHESRKSGRYSDDRSGFNQDSFDAMNSFAREKGITIRHLEEKDTAELLSAKLKKRTGTFKDQIPLRENLSFFISESIKNIINQQILP